MRLDSELLRWLLVVLAAPIWWPFLRTVWRDIDEALAEEGGIFGREPGPRDIQRIQERKATRPDPLHSEPWVRPDEPTRPAGFQRRGRKRGFR